jgi:hypothetical protein
MCRSSQDRQRQAIRDYQTRADEHRNRINQQTQENNQLRATATALRAQLATRGVTPHPATEHRFSGSIPRR